MRIGEVVALPSVVVSTAGGLRVTIGYGQPYLVECHCGESYLVRAICGGRLLDARYWVNEAALGEPRRPSRTRLRRSFCHEEFDRARG